MKHFVRLCLVAVVSVFVAGGGCKKSADTSPSVQPAAGDDGKSQKKVDVVKPAEGPGPIAVPKKK
jgi:hypothetical protein